MLSAKEILQIDATILAGIFILLTVISINTGDNPTQQLQKINDEINALEQLKIEKTILEQKSNTLIQDADRLSYESKLSGGNSSELKLLEMNATMNEFYKTKQDLFAIENQLSHEDQLREEQNQTQGKIDKRISETLNFLSKLPEVWMYRVGVAFSFSAICALFMSIYENSQISRMYKILKYLSYGSMLAGFVFLIVIFDAIVLP